MNLHMQKIFLVTLLTLSAYFVIAQSANEDLLRAAIIGDLGMVNAALGNKAKLEAKDGEGRTPLLVAAKLGHPSVCIVLLDKGALVDAKDNEGWTALMLAAREGHDGIVPILLDKGAGIEAREKAGRTALMVAAENGQTAVMGILLERGAIPKFTKDEELENTQTDDLKENLNATLLNAILTHDQAEASRALKAGAFPDTRSKRHIPALIMATSRKQEDIVQAILDAGGDVNIRATDTEKGIDQITALHIAASNGNMPILNSLLGAKANTNAQDKTGFTPLMAAADFGSTVAIILLLDHGAQANLQTNTGEAALLFAVTRGNLDAARILLEKGADPNLADKEMTTPLMIAAQLGDTDMTKLLIASKADPKLRRGANGYRAADFARLGGHKEIIALLKD
jgi:uncharacterized protein